MKEKGLVRCVDSLGRITLLKEDRKLLGVLRGGKIQVIRNRNTIILKKDEEVCAMCDSEIRDNTKITLFNKAICQKCVKKFINKFFLQVNLCTMHNKSYKKISIT